MHHQNRDKRRSFRLLFRRVTRRIDKSALPQNQPWISGGAARRLQTSDHLDYRNSHFVTRVCTMAPLSSTRLLSVTWGRGDLLRQQFSAPMYWQGKAGLNDLRPKSRRSIYFIEDSDIASYDKYSFDQFSGTFYPHSYR